MAGKGRKRGLDGSNDGRIDDGPRPGLAFPRIGIIGKTTLTEDEIEDLTYLGRCIARLGHTLVSIPTPGTETVVREGMKAEGGVTVELETDVLGNADHTLVYADDRLLRRLLNVYPSLREMSNVTVLHEGLLVKWVVAVERVLDEKNLGTPPRYPGGPK